MIVTNIEGLGRYAGLNPHFPKLIEYLANHNLLNEELGRIDVDGDNLFINNINPQCVPAEKQVLEMHREYIDVHILLSGSETIGWKPIEDIEVYSKEYCADGDCALSTDAPTCMVTMRPGDVVIVFPEDPHAPVIGGEKIRKCIAKVRL